MPRRWRPAGIPRLQIVAIEEWFKGKRPLLPPLEHLPSAAFSGRRRPAKPKPGDPEQPELPLKLQGWQGSTAPFQSPNGSGYGLALPAMNYPEQLGSLRRGRDGRNGLRSQRGVN
jgi:hypothetical protein